MITEHRPEEGAASSQDNLVSRHLAIIADQGAVTQGGGGHQGGQGAAQGGEKVPIFQL